MRVWLVNHYALRPAESGGTRHFTLARELVRLGHEPTIVASSFDHFAKRDRRLEGRHSHGMEEIEGVRFLWLRTPPYGGNGMKRVVNMGVFAARLLSGTAERLLPKPDVIVGSSPSLFAAAAAERAARRLGVPFVLEVRDLWPQSLIDLGVSERHPFIAVLSAIEKRVYTRADRIITLLPNAAEHMVAKGARKDDIVWLPNGVDLHSIPDPSPPRERSKFTVAYVGTHSLANSLGTILDCAKLMEQDGWGDRVHFRFVGNGDEKSQLVERARTAKLSTVTFEDAVPKSEVFGIYDDADACVLQTKDLPLYRFGISMNKLHEYMAAARPVIYGGNAPKNPVALANAGIVIAPENPAQLRDAVKELASMTPVQRWQMGKRGREFVERHNDFAAIASQLEQVLLSVVPPGRAAGVPRSVGPYATGNAA